MLRIHSCCCCFNVYKAQCCKFFSVAYKFENEFYLGSKSAINILSYLYATKNTSHLSERHKIQFIRVKAVYSIEKGDAQPEVPLDLNLYPQPPPQTAIGLLEYVTGRVIKGPEGSCSRRHLWHSQLLALNVIELLSPLYPQL